MRLLRGARSTRLVAGQTALILIYALQADNRRQRVARIVVVDDRHLLGRRGVDPLL